jgi:glycoprotein 6-alpha-L-fucosyltransferase
LELETTDIQRTVYIATDEPSLFEEAKTKYPHYTFLGDPNIASLAKNTSARKSDTALKSLLTDMHFLSRSDFIVCTFSSNVCRVVYPLMQTYHPDASADAQSLDDVFYFSPQPEHLQRALVPHMPRDPTEIELQAGDLIHISGNFWNGSTDGINKRTGKKGLYPSYKVEEVISVALMPIEP